MRRRREDPPLIQRAPPERVLKVPSDLVHCDQYVLLGDEEEFSSSYWDILGENIKEMINSFIKVSHSEKHHKRDVLLEDQRRAE